MYDGYYYGCYGRAHPRTPSPDFEANPLTGWKDISDKDLRDSDLHPSQFGEPRLYTGPYEAAVKKSSWIIPQVPHPLSLLLGQLSRPKFCSSNRWIYSPECNWYGWLPDSRLTSIKLFSSADGAALGTIGTLNLDAVRNLATASPFGMGRDTVYDDSVRRGTEVRASQLIFGLGIPLVNTPGLLRNGEWYFEDIAHHVGSYLFPGAREVKLVLYKLAMYTPGGHFKMHKDTTHADSHVGTLLIGCGTTQDDEPGDEDWEALDEDELRLAEVDRFGERASRSPTTNGYSGGDLVILNDFSEETRYHIRPGQVLAFCTDVPHAVDVVTSGVKVTLQFDIYLEDASVSREHTVAIVDLAKHGQYSPRKDTDDSDDTSDANDISDKDVSHDDASKKEETAQLPCPSCDHPGCVLTDEKVIAEYLDPNRQYWRQEWFNQPEHFNSALTHWEGEESAFGRYPRETFTTAVDRFTLHLLALLRDASLPEGAPRTVTFLLSHMYRKRSIRPEYLKTVDDVLYRALVATGQLSIILHHVTFEVNFHDHQGQHKLTLCPPYAAGVSPKDIMEPVMVLNRPGSDVTGLLSHQDEAIARGEIYVGNEAIEENGWYVAGAMFVSLL